MRLQRESRVKQAQHTVVALSNAVLYSSALSKVRDLGPVLIGVGRSTESTACSRVLSGRWRSCRVGVGGLCHKHGHCEVVIWVSVGCLKLRIVDVDFGTTKL